MTPTPPVRVRFAPSPTGYLHVGGLRTALYNYLFARSRGGAFILRIEDTDRARYVEGAIENLINTLRWIGLDFDEGPDIGGPYGPYIQSERLAVYQEHVGLLRAQGKAYPCFCTPEELEDMRNRQVLAKQPPMYDRRCRALSEDEVRSRMDGGRSFTIRMKVPLFGDAAFRDLIRGDITVAHKVIDDQVLLKSDGFPTYHLANVVDDHLMGITHVIRGEEWLPSTAKHVMLYEMFGWTPPAFAHLPLLLNPDRSKLSKRQGDVAVEDYRRKGYLPDALLNFVALLGWNTADNQELFSREELSSKFSLDRVGKAGAVFDLEKLNWFNAQYLRALPADRLAGLVRPHLAAAGFTPPDELLSAVLDAISSHLTLPGDIVGEAAVFFEESPPPPDPESETMLAGEDALAVLRAFVDGCGGIDPWNRHTVKDFIKRIQKETGRSGKALFMPIRLALTGRMHGPELPVIAEIFGREKCRSRIAARLAL